MIILLTRTQIEFSIILEHPVKINPYETFPCIIALISFHLLGPNMRWKSIFLKRSNFNQTTSVLFRTHCSRLFTSRDIDGRSVRGYSVTVSNLSYRRPSVRKWSFQASYSGFCNFHCAFSTVSKFLTFI